MDYFKAGWTLKHGLKNPQISIVFTALSMEPMRTLLLDITKGLAIPLTSAALIANTP